ncbi:manganese transporter [Actinoalloteichus sp. AHMU CJ021]|uniref:Manganese/zinc/iron transport system substrate-binding protein n=1 Tax=Actinoalloteichus caeruleus DSM 43889 TaxID=1120930 RepID=A0ABT1JC96_ACTCY|nr:zinc ABC transporter substrate-binding protein [Actinoalloteichus caeruleus]AUS80547.1 manganese transporter [Actinoalloteichus sp. AHMU CJ021]MCP2329914.1 manganese/zinc/iron transport system substrate-binding protein [Actinoalloteichus caeruleus DSM 43889]
MGLSAAVIAAGQHDREDIVPDERPGSATDRRSARRRRARVILITTLVAVVATIGLIVFALRPTDDTTARATGDEAGLRVVATTNFLTDTVRRIGGEHVDVAGLMGPGVDPHLFQARAGHLHQLREADLVLSVGLHLEGNLQTVLDGLGDTAVVRVAESIPESELLAAPDTEPGDGEFDPHVWFDVSLWSRVVEGIRDALVAEDPERATAYRDAADEYLVELADLDEEVRDRLAEIPEQRRVLVTSHDAFRYLGRAYDVQVEAIQGISTVDEATTADIDRVAALIAERGVRAVFVESSVSGQSLEAVLAAAGSRGAEVTVGGELFSDAAGAEGTPEGTYVGMVRANVDQLVEGLR